MILLQIRLIRCTKTELPPAKAGVPSSTFPLVEMDWKRDRAFLLVLRMRSPNARVGEDLLTSGHGMNGPWRHAVAVGDHVALGGRAFQDVATNSAALQ
jgi:hypothetical protein